MKTRKSKWSEIFDTHYGKLYGYPKSPCQVSEKFIIGKVKISRHYTNQIAVGQALLKYILPKYVCKIADEVYYFMLYSMLFYGISKGGQQGYR